MAQNLQMNISDVLKEQTNTNRTYHAQDEKETNVGGRPRINEEEKLTKQIRQCARPRLPGHRRP